MHFFPLAFDLGRAEEGRLGVDMLANGRSTEQVISRQLVSVPFPR